MDQNALYQNLLKRVTQEPSLADTMTLVAQQLSTTDFPCFSIGLYDAQKHRLVFRTSYNFGQKILNPNGDVPCQGTLCGQAFETGKPIFRSHLDSYSDAQLQPFHKDQIKTVLLLPLIFQNEKIGVLSFFSPDTVSLTESAIQEYSEIGLFLALLVEHHRANTLQAEKSFTEELIETANVMILSLDLHGKVKSLNAAAQRLTGYTLQELQGKNWFELMVPKDRYPQVWDELSLTSTDHLPKSFENLILTKSQEERCVVWNNCAILRNEKITGTICYGIDITDRKKSELALHENEERFRLIAAETGNILYDWDINTGKIEWHGAIEEITGFSPAEFQKIDIHGWEQLVHSDDRPEVSKNLQTAIEAKRRFHDEYRFQRKDGSYAFMEERGVFLPTTKEHKRRMVGILKDITEQKQQQKHIQELLELEHKARTEAEKANHTKDLFLSTLSHELRTPLTTILTWTQLIRTGKLDSAKMQRGMEMIEKAAQAQAQLINDLLDISRIASGKCSVKIGTVFPVPIINTVVDSFRATLEEKQIAVIREIDQVSAGIAADPTRLQQVFWNVFGNAVKFVPVGGKIWIEVKQSESETIIRVRDNGIGIAPDFLPKLFTHFSQADSSSTRHYGGLGLGLAITNNLVKLMKGTIQAESPGKNQGAVFTITLPTQEPVSVKPFQSLSNSLLKLGVIEKIKEKSILCVDDDPATLEAFSLLLSSFGLRVTTASSAKEAMQFLAHSKPDLIMSDLGMPEEDGYSLVQKIKKLWSDIPVIAVTAFASTQDSRKATLHGFDHYLPKPINSDHLIQLILKYTTQGDVRVKISQPSEVTNTVCSN